MSRKGFPLAACVLLAACDPYTRFVGESSAGAVDPVKFPAPYLGDGGDGKTPGMGKLSAVAAFVADAPIGYYSFPYMGDLSLATEGALSVPIAYNFDTGATGKCVPPDSYVFDQQRDAVRFDQQGDIFTLLPDDPSYVPVVADVTVTPNGLPCQDTKSELNVVKRDDVTLALIQPEHPDEVGAHATGKPSGKFFARAIIDPSIDVRFPDGSVDPNTGLGPQSWGWFQRYLLAFIDGGQVPVLDKDVVNSTGQAQRVTQMVTQALYFPTQHPGMDMQGNMVPVPAMGAGEGFDVLEHTRGDAMYSPLCEVFSFDPKDPMAPETNVKNIDQATVMPTGNFVFCLQVAQ
jgi:hypothetical protein